MNYNNILVQIRDDRRLDDYYVQVSLGQIKLSRDEINLLNSILWELSWDIDGTFSAYNEKHWNYWIFEFPRSVLIEPIAERVFQRLVEIFPNRVARYK